MIIELEETKAYLRVDGDEEDELIESLIAAAEEYLINATGNQFDGENSLARLFCWVLVADWYENREHVGHIARHTRPIVKSMVAQLKHCYPEVAE